MKYTFKGRVAEVCQTQTFPSGFTKRELVVAEEGANQWPNKVTFNFKRDNAEKLKDVRPGDAVTVTFALDGREWTDPRTNKVRHFSDLVGLDIASGASGARDSVPSSDAQSDLEERETEYPF